MKGDTKVVIENRRGHDYTALEMVERGKKLKKIVSLESQFGITKEHQLSSGRTFVLHSAKEYSTLPSLLLFFHGSRGNARCDAYETTRLIEKAAEENFLVAFGQAREVPGEIPRTEYCYMDPNWNHAAFGENYWEIRDNFPGFDQDIQYIHEMLSLISSVFPYDKTRIFFSGFSNGGVFSMLLPLHVPGLFRGICSMMGGIGHDPYFYLDFSKLKQDAKKTSILLLTGENDVHRKPTETAFNLFESEGFEVKMECFDGCKHAYYYDHESAVWQWMRSLK